MAASSSASSMFPVGITFALSIGFAPVAGSEHRQQDTEGRAPRSRVAFDDAAVVADDLRNQGKSQATPLGFGGHEGFEQVGQEVGRNARSVVAHRQLDR